MKNGVKAILYMVLLVVPLLSLNSESSSSQSQQTIGNKRFTSPISSEKTKKLKLETSTTKNSFVIGIIGATGHVGKTIAHTLLNTEVPSELILWGRNTHRCSGEAADLDDGRSDNVSITFANNVQEVAPADIIIIAAGVAQQPGGQTRDELLATNSAIISDFIEQLQRAQNRNDNAIILIVTNPVEDLAHVAYKYAQKKEYLADPARQILGSGTSLDTRRIRHNLSNMFSQLNTTQIKHTYVLGEHGDTQFVAWSHAQQNGLQLEEEQKKEVEEATRRKAYGIINAKGYTQFGIARCVADVCQGIKHPEKEYLTPLSVYNKEYGVYISQLTHLGRTGVTIIPGQEEFKLNEKELEKLHICIQKRKSAIASLQGIIFSS